MQQMKLLLTTIAVVLLVGCGESQPPEPPDISIYQAASDGNIEAVKWHLDADADVNAKDYDGWPALHYAADEGHKEIAELLITKGADLEAVDQNGWTPLHYAAYKGHKEVVELLIPKGADVNVKGILGTPLDLANRGGQTEIADLLRKHGGKYGTIHGAARGGGIEAVKEFLAAGVDVNAKAGDDDTGDTPLHKAAFNNHKEIAELLIAKGADVNAKNNFGRTPLDNAIGRKLPEIADLLRKHGGKTGAELNGGKPVAEAAKPEPPTAKAPDISIHEATEEGNIEAVKQYLAAGKDVNVKDKRVGYFGRTPLLYATEEGNIEAVKQY